MMKTEAPVDCYYLPREVHFWKRTLADGEWRLYLDVENIHYVAVNPSGAAVLDALRRHNDVPSIAADLRRRFDDSISEDPCRAFLEAMVEKDFVSRTPPEDPEEEEAELGPPGSLYLLMTNACNLSCTYCYNAADRKELASTTKRLSTEDYKKILDDAAEAGVQSVTFSGGEPLLRRDLFELAEYAGELGLARGIITNGTLLRKHLDKLGSAFETITVSMDGDSPETNDPTRGEGVYEEVIAGLRAVRAATDCTMSVAAVMTKHNVRSLKGLWKTVKELKLRGKLIPALWTQEAGWEEGDEDLRPSIEEMIAAEDEVADYLLEEMRKHPDDFHLPLNVIPQKKHCGVGYSISLGPDGSIYPCQSLVTPAMRAGNAREDSISNIFANSDLLKRCRDMTPESMEGCSTCELRHICAGGCRALGYRLTGELDGRDESWCDYYKAMWTKRLWRAALQENRETMDPLVYEQLTQ